MCKAIDKMLVFSYMVDKLVDRQLNIENKNNDSSSSGMNNHQVKSAIIKTFSNTRVMKLLYLICLESYKISKKKGNDKYNLFNLFNDFYAYPNGPVCLDVYNQLEKTEIYEYKDGAFTGEYKKDSSINKNVESVENFDYFNEVIDLSITYLLSDIGDETFLNRDKLVALTHKLPLWKHAYIYAKDYKLDVASKCSLNKELDAYEPLTKKEDNNKSSKTDLH